MYPYSSANEKLSQAVRILAIGKGMVKSRLWSAFLELSTLRLEDFPQSLQVEYVAIRNELTKRRPKNDLDEKILENDGIVQFNLTKMRNSSGTQIAIMIYNLHIHIQSASIDWHSNQIRTTTDNKF